MLYTSHDSIITFSVPGVTLDRRSWDKFQGGAHQADTQNYPPGGHAPSVAVSGVTKRDTATLERAWDDVLIGAYMALDAAVGGPCAIGVTPSKTASTKAANRRSYTGVIKEVKPPDNDSTSSSISQLQIVIELNEPIT